MVIELTIENMQDYRIGSAILACGQSEDDMFGEIETVSVAGCLSCWILAERSTVLAGDHPRGSGLLRPWGLILVIRSTMSLLLASWGNSIFMPLLVLVAWPPVRPLI